MSCFQWGVWADADVGYQAPLTRGQRDLPCGANFYTTDGMLSVHCSCHHNTFHGKWDGETFHEIKTIFWRWNARFVLLKRGHFVIATSQSQCAPSVMVSI